MSNQHCADGYRPLAAALNGPVRRIYEMVIDPIRSHVRARAGARELAQLDDRLLRDIGLTRSQIRAAAFGRISGDRASGSAAPDTAGDQSVPATPATVTALVRELSDHLLHASTATEALHTWRTARRLSVGPITVVKQGASQSRCPDDGMLDELRSERHERAAHRCVRLVRGPERYCAALLNGVQAPFRAVGEHPSVEQDPRPTGSRADPPLRLEPSRSSSGLGRAAATECGHVPRITKHSPYKESLMSSIRTARHAIVAKDVTATLRTDPADRQGTARNLAEVRAGPVDPVLYWNDVALDANRASHSTANGEQTGPTPSSRALAIVHLAIHAIVHLAIHDAYFGVEPSFEAALGEARIPAEDAATSRAYGLAVADAIVAKLAIKPGERGADAAHYWSADGKGRHREDPDNAGQGFDAPDYGMTAGRIAVTAEHEIAPPPALTDDAYNEALREVRAKGGAPGLPTTKRRPEETIVGTYWAYDGSMPLDTPPRLYNGIVRVVADKKGNGSAENARLFALVNAAMGDAGIFAWKEKYCHDLWRPVLGIRP